MKKDNYITEEMRNALRMIDEGCDKLVKCVKSSVTLRQLDSCSNMLANYRHMVSSLYGIQEDGRTCRGFMQRIGLWRKRDVVKEIISNTLDGALSCVLREISDRRKTLSEYA